MATVTIQDVCWREEAQLDLLGFTISIGLHCVKHGCNVESTISLSSGDSEYYVLVKASAIGMSVRALLEDCGEQYDLAVYSDYPAARGTASRRGLGKLRHAQTRYLWMQESTANDDLNYCRSAQSIIQPTFVRSQ